VQACTSSRQQAVAHGACVVLGVVDARTHLRLCAPMQHWPLGACLAQGRVHAQTRQARAVIHPVQKLLGLLFRVEQATQRAVGQAEGPGGGGGAPSLDLCLRKQRYTLNNRDRAIDKQVSDQCRKCGQYSPARSYDVCLCCRCTAQPHSHAGGCSGRRGS